MTGTGALPSTTRSAILTGRDGGQVEVLIDGPGTGSADRSAGGSDPQSVGASGTPVATASSHPLPDSTLPAATIALLPSSLRDARDLGPLAAHLAAAGWQVLRPQPRGMGASSAPPPGMTLHDLADDVARAIATFGSGRAIVAGHAFGHFVARVTDLDHAPCVRGVVVIAGAARVFPPGLPSALERAADPAQPRDARLAALQQAFFAPKHDPSSWLDGWYPHLRAAYREAGATPDKSVWWPVSHAPILDLQAADDPWRPPDTRDELRSALGDRVTVQLIAEASHALPDEQPAAVARAIASWAAALPA